MGEVNKRGSGACMVAVRNRPTPNPLHLPSCTPLTSTGAWVTLSYSWLATWDHVFSDGEPPNPAAFGAFLAPYAIFQAHYYTALERERIRGLV